MAKRIVQRALAAGLFLYAVSGCGGEPTVTSPAPIEGDVELLATADAVAGERPVQVTEGRLVDARRVILVFEAGSCDAVSQARVEEKSDRVDVAIKVGIDPTRAQGSDSGGGAVCDSMAHSRGFPVDLAAALQGRKLIDTASGVEVPVVVVD